MRSPPTSSPCNAKEAAAILGAHCGKFVPDRHAHRHRQIGQVGAPSWPSKDSWLEYPDWQLTRGLRGQPIYVTTADDRREPCALPPIIRWIRQKDDEAWLKA